MSIKSEVMRYPLTYAFIIVNVLVYFLSSSLSQDFVDMKIVVLVDMGALFGPLVLQEGEWWRLFTSMFLHGGMTHILMNMFSLYIIGRSAEMYFEKKAYISIYLFSGLIGGFSSLYMHPESVGVGASGAIFGIFGALAGFFLAHREQIVKESKSFMKDFAIILGINLLIGLSIPSVDVSAHIGGLAVGVVGGFILSKNPKWIFMYWLAMMVVMLFMAKFLLSGH